MPLSALAALRGVTALPGKTGWYAVRPSQIADMSPLRHMRKQAEAIAPLVAEDQFNRASMLAGGIEDLIGAKQRAVSLGLRDNEPTRGLIHLAPSGRADATAAIDLEYGKNALRGHARMGHDDPFFREFQPNYLNHVATDNPDIAGSSILRMLQEAYGPEMLFQVADPKKNIPIYERMGAKRAPLSMEGEDILGDPDMPAYYFDSLIQRLPRPSSQLLLPLD